LVGEGLEGVLAAGRPTHASVPAASADLVLPSEETRRHGGPVAGRCAALLVGSMAAGLVALLVLLLGLEAHKGREAAGGLGGSFEACWA
jgi:hypothetical protein